MKTSKRDVEAMAYAWARHEAECEDFVRNTRTLSAALLKLSDAMWHLRRAIVTTLLKVRG